MKCAMKACASGLEGKYYPVIVVFPLGYTREQRRHMTGAEMILNTKVCGQCQKTLTPDDFIGDEGWEQIKNAFEAQGKAEPDRKTVQLGFSQRDFETAFKKAKE